MAPTMVHLRSSEEAMLILTLSYASWKRSDFFISRNRSLIVIHSIRILRVLQYMYVSTTRRRLLKINLILPVVFRSSGNLIMSSSKSRLLNSFLLVTPAP